MAGLREKCGAAACLKGETRDLAAAPSAGQDLASLALKQLQEPPRRDGRGPA